jgi:hypothetical protein
MEQRTFDLAEFISASTGYLVSDMSSVYEVLNFVSGDELYTHQLPRVSEEFRDVFFKEHPEYAPILEESKTVTTENWEEKLADWKARFGETITLTPMEKGQHEYKNPTIEMLEMMGNNKEGNEG